MGNNIEELKDEAIEIIKNNPNDINVDLLRRKLKIGLIKANKLMEILKTEGVVK